MHNPWHHLLYYYIDALHGMTGNSVNTEIKPHPWTICIIITNITHTSAAVQTPSPKAVTVRHWWSTNNKTDTRNNMIFTNRNWIIQNTIGTFTDNVLWIMDSNLNNIWLCWFVTLNCIGHVPGSRFVAQIISCVFPEFYMFYNGLTAASPTITAVGDKAISFVLSLICL